MELVKETCLNSPSDNAKATSHRLFATSYMIGGLVTAAPPAASEAAVVEALRYISTYYEE